MDDLTTSNQAAQLILTTNTSIAATLQDQAQQNASLAQQLAAMTADDQANKKALAGALLQIAQLMQQAGSVAGFSVNNVEALAGWILAKGAAGNTNASGNTGTGSFVYDASQKSATVSIVPTLPKVDPTKSAEFNGYFYIKLCGTDPDTGKPCPFPMPSFRFGLFIYEAEYYVPPTFWAARHCAENEHRWHKGGFRYIMASQGRLGTTGSSWHIYDHGAPAGSDKWWDSKVPCTMIAGSWHKITTLFQINPLDGTYVCLGIVTDDGVYHALNKAISADSYTTHKDWYLNSVQPDSDAAGDPFQYQVRNVKPTIL